MSSNTTDQSISSILDPASGPIQNQSASHNVGVTAGIIGIVFLIGIILYLVFRLYIAKLYNQSQRRDASVASFPATVPPKLGLELEAISMLPKFVYEPRTRSGRVNGPNGSVLECAVCISELIEGEMVRVLPTCKHFFHLECIDTWLSTHSSCPMCRAHPKPGKMKLDILSAASPLPQLKLFRTSSDGGDQGLGPCLGSPFRKSPRKSSTRFSLHFLKSPRGVSARLGRLGSPFVSTPRGASARLGSPAMLTPRATDLNEIRIDPIDLHEIRIDDGQFR